jgi:lactate permease
VAFGALGTPIIALARVTGLPARAAERDGGRQLPFFSLLIPFWLVWAMAGRAGMLEVWPACLAAGASFALVQFLVSNSHGPWLVDIAASIASMGALLALLACGSRARLALAGESAARPRPVRRRGPRGARPRWRGCRGRCSR